MSEHPDPGTTGGAGGSLRVSSRNRRSMVGRISCRTAPRQCASMARRNGMKAEPAPARISGTTDAERAAIGPFDIRLVLPEQDE